MIQSLVSERRQPSQPAQPTPLIPNSPLALRQMTSTVPRQLVHRAAVAEVFLTGWAVLDETRIRVHAQWPRAHSFYTPRLGHYDPLLLAETIRQAGVLVAHSVYDVSLEQRFLMRDLHYAANLGRLAVGDRPADLELDVAFTQRRGSGGRFSAAYTVTARRDGHVVATGGAGFSCVSPAAYHRLRGRRPSLSPSAPIADPCAPLAVGRTSESDVVLAPTGSPQSWQLRVDTGHPILFDHPNDHVPGMVLVEAARQVSIAASAADTCRIPVSMNTAFHRYAEFGIPCRLTAEPHPDGADGMRVVGRQDGEEVFTSLVTTAELGAR